MGIECTFIDSDASIEDIQRKSGIILAYICRDNSESVFGSVGYRKLAKVAHSNDIPLIIDNTFATPINCDPSNMARMLFIPHRNIWWPCGTLGCYCDSGILTGITENFRAYPPR